ncbi:glycoside hydrolase family 43 protein [Cellulomonas alba]|uniref:Glycoside hydrolase 43 family protein n=1 Tax=Cellulomonas alba TaxID=3053467 RepID=A0ABT7SJW7_9CELL|nr:glycoside hydrolase 43 family protein [Cellulomonas alba]MDM7856481.1 glycoside hydrolase 43 family protein [Cellulomonas alba]
MADASSPVDGDRATFSNPVVWQDFADGDVIRVGDAYYYSASTMHYSPGAPILRSYDLVHWEHAGHSVPRLDFDSDAYDLVGGQAYVRGIWASAFAHRASDGTFWWLGQVEFDRTYVYRAPAVDGPWTRHARLEHVYYDAGLLFDDDGAVYVAYGNTTISVAELTPDLTGQVRAQVVLETPASIGVLEGARLYRRGDWYYLWLTRPANGQFVARAASPFGPYELREVLLDLPGPVPGGGVPHQGGLVETVEGDWWYVAFTDAYPGGRMPTLAPVRWTDDGWPELVTVDGRWGATYPAPPIATDRAVAPMTGLDVFEGDSLGPQWEWNHNPDPERFRVGDGLHLRTATVTDDLYAARNTLTRRIQGPTSTATVELDVAGMTDGDVAGLAMLRQTSAWIGVERARDGLRVVMRDGLTMDAGTWETTSTGTERAAVDLTGPRVWLRAHADIRPDHGVATFAYSTDGATFVPLGPEFALDSAWQFFMGYRFAVFHHARIAGGGEVVVRGFELAVP